MALRRMCGGTNRRPPATRGESLNQSFVGSSSRAVLGFQSGPARRTANLDSSKDRPPEVGSVMLSMAVVAATQGPAAWLAV